jgi:hypothetical protein
LNIKLNVKRLIAVLLLGFSVAAFCAAQTETGNASYDSSKTGFSITHSSLSFNTRVKVTNLRNGLSVEAVVNGRPRSSDRIADISRDAGDALGMDKSGMTMVQIEKLPPRVNTQSTAPVETPAQEEPPPKPAPPPVIVIPATPAPVQQNQPDQPVVSTQILPVQTITDIQYVPVPASPSCPPYCLPVIVALLVLVILLLSLILVLLLRRFPLWPWRYPFWLRRYYHRRKKQQRRN